MGVRAPEKPEGASAPRRSRAVIFGRYPFFFTPAARLSEAPHIAGDNKSRQPRLTHLSGRATCNPVVAARP